MLSWVGIDQLMKMRVTSRAVDKKLQDNNKLRIQAFLSLFKGQGIDTSYYQRTGHS